MIHATTLEQALLARAIATADRHAVDAAPLRDQVWRRLRAAGWTPSIARDRQRPAPHVSDDALAQRFAAGDGGAFDELYRRHAGALLGHACRRLAGSRAEDAVQDTFLVLLDRSPEMQPGKVKAFLFGVLRNKLRKAHTRQARTEFIDNATRAEAKDVDVLPRDFLHHEALVQVIEDTCNELEQTILAMHIDGHQSADIASAVGLSAGAVRVRLSRLRKRLQDALAQDPP